MFGDTMNIVRNLRIGTRHITGIATLQQGESDRMVDIEQLVDQT